jgi:iron(III) transport system permease protein
MPKSTSRPGLKLLLGGFAAAAIAALWMIDPRVGQLWLNTALLAAGACLVALPLGTLAAIAVFKTDLPGRRLAGLLVTAMLFVPMFIVTGAWNAGFGLQGWQTLATNPHLAHEPWLTGWRAAIWIHGLAGVPWVVLLVGAGLRHVEAELEEDAALCAAPARVVWHVTLRRSAPALLVAALWVAITASTEISVTDFFQVRTFAEEVYTQAALGSFDFVGEPGPVGPTLSTAGLWIGLFVYLLLGLLTMVAVRTLFGEVTHSPIRPPWLWRLESLRWPAAAVLCAVMVLVAGLPLANLVYKAGVQVTATATGRVRDWSAAKVVERVAAAPREFRGELILSGAISAAAATGAVVIAIPLAWSMRLTRGIPWSQLAALSLCLTIPGPLLGIGLIRLLNQPPGATLAPLAALYDSNFAPWLVQTLRALPLVTLILWAALGTIPRVMLDAAATDGAGWWGQLLRIALPQRWQAVAAAWLVGFAVAVGEVAATVLVMPPGRSTAISVRIFQLLHYGVDDRVAAISLVLVLATATMTAIAATMLKRMYK